MTTTSNVAKATAAYQGFMTGNMEPLFAQLHADVTWNHHSNSETSFPGTYKGQQGVMEYFGHMAEIEMEKFELKLITEKETYIFVVLETMRTIKASGKREGGQEVHMLQYEDDRLLQMDVYQPLV